MTLRQLSERLAEIVAENERADARREAAGRMRENRNDADIMVEVYRGGRPKPHYYPIHYASGSIAGVTFASDERPEGERMDIFCLHTKETAKRTHQPSVRYLKGGPNDPSR